MLQQIGVWHYVRAMGEGKIEGILHPFGSPNRLDSHRTWTDAQTKFGLGVYPVVPVFFHHNLHRLGGEPMRAGVFTLLRLDTEGVYAQAQLELTSEDGLRCYECVDQGVGFWSAEFMPHMYDVREDGYLTVAPIIGGSVTPSPSNDKRRVQVRHIRSFVDVGDLADDEFLLRSDEMTLPQVPPNGGTPPAQPAPVSPTSPAPSAPLSVDQSALSQQIALLQQGITDLQNLRSFAPTAPLPKTPVIEVSSRYDDTSLFGKLLYYEWIRAKNYKTSGGVHWLAERGEGSEHEKFIRSMLMQVQAAVKKQGDEGLLRLSPTQQVEHLRCIDSVAVGALEKRFKHLRANEFMGSTVAGFGDELVPTLLNSVAYYNFRLLAQVWGLFETFSMPTNPFDWATIAGGGPAPAGNGPILRRVTEIVNQSSASVPASLYPVTRIATAKKTFNSPAKLGAMTLLSGELFEDSGLSMADVTATQFAQNIADAVDYVLLNGDETASVANISHDSVDPTGTVYDSVLLVDGLRRFAFIDDAALNTSQAIATLAVESINLLRAQMGTAGRLGINPKNLAVVLSPQVYYKLLGLATFQTLQNMGQDRATLLTGQVDWWFNIPVVVSDQVELGSALGVYPSTHAGTLGTWGVVFRPGIKVGTRRDFNMEIFNGRQQGFDGMIAVGDIRLDIQEMQAGCSSWAFNTTV